MTDFIAIARQGRVTALNLHESGAVTFFPEDFEDDTRRPDARQVITQVSKPMFVRSSAMQQVDMVETPDMQDAANAPFLLTEDLAIENVLRLAA